MSDEKKTVADEFADALLQGLTRGAAKGVAAVARHVQKELTKPLARAADAFDKIAACTCDPVWREVEGPDGELERVLVHAKGCPAR